MDWARNVFVKNAKLYQLVLEGMWERGEEDAVAISSYLGEEGLKGCRVLDAPCGIGRVAIPLARLGFDVSGIDLSPHLVGVADKKAAQFKPANGRTRFLVGDMRELGSRFAPSSFDVVLNVFTSIGYGSEEDDLRFFREARAVTRRGGLLLISGLRNRDYIARNPSQNVYEESRRLLVLDTYSFDSARSREKGVWRFYLKRGEKGGEALKFAGEFPVDIRVYSPHELVPRLEATGWSVKETYESFTTRSPCRADSPVYALVAKAA
ncbi:MAG TPA: class I SAM-dependent methyltransferase [Nitrososphaerales archaeon]|nr:class I SAM-dependent methyltransferase [Nitrososphaerales archaeon]